MSYLKVSVIGTGHLGSIHTKLWKENPTTKLLGIFDVSRVRAAELSQKYDCIHFQTLNQAIEESDALIIAVPTINHFEVALKCIEKGKHCLIEKPITSTYEQALKLNLLAKEQNVKIQVGHVERFNPAMAALNKLDVHPLFIEAHRLSQFKPRATDVSVIHDLMIHDIDIVLSLIKSPIKQIDANGVAVLTENPDICNARLTFENGAVANLTASRISATQMRKMRIFQKEAYISIDFAKPNLEIFRILDEGNLPQDSLIPATMLGSIEAGLRNKNIFLEKPNLPILNAIDEEQKAFADAINNNTPVPVSGEDAAEALKIAEQISLIISKQINKN
ncbi:MAG: Gfo/Idh/MocA family oxidoreductase [Candidatus Kapabacteria bacterium]|nr:Gfo/Idh/MocA family oxidoreductase [Candidatus Kapabacteria bacterium]